jgi:hypothetical protein
MEEKKLNLQGTKKETKSANKLTYEQLNEACSQLYQQNQNLVKQLQQANMVNMFKRLDYLFKVIEYGGMFDDKFLDDCVSEIKDAMTVTSEDTKESEEG